MSVPAASSSSKRQSGRNNPVASDVGFGFAASGGGVRAAAIFLGVMKGLAGDASAASAIALNQAASPGGGGIYISSVSGGGWSSAPLTSGINYFGSGSNPTGQTLTPVSDAVREVENGFEENAGYALSCSSCRAFWRTVLFVFVLLGWLLLSILCLFPLVMIAIPGLFFVAKHTFYEEKPPRFRPDKQWIPMVVAVASWAVFSAASYLEKIRPLLRSRTASEHYPARGGCISLALIGAKRLLQVVSFIILLGSLSYTLLIISRGVSSQQATASSNIIELIVAGGATLGIRKISSSPGWIGGWAAFAWIYFTTNVLEWIMFAGNTLVVIPIEYKYAKVVHFMAATAGLFILSPLLWNWRSQLWPWYWSHCISNLSQFRNRGQDVGGYANPIVGSAEVNHGHAVWLPAFTAHQTKLSAHGQHHHPVWIDTRTSNIRGSDRYQDMVLGGSNGLKRYCCAPFECCSEVRASTLAGYSASALATFMGDEAEAISGAISQLDHELSAISLGGYVNRKPPSCGDRVWFWTLTIIMTLGWVALLIATEATDPTDDRHINGVTIGWLVAALLFAVYSFLPHLSPLLCVGPKCCRVQSAFTLSPYHRSLYIMLGVEWYGKRIDEQAQQLDAATEDTPLINSMASDSEDDLEAGYGGRPVKRAHRIIDAHSDLETGPPALYLSDGGHSLNLPMVPLFQEIMNGKKIARIVAVDAEEDILRRGKGLLKALKHARSKLGVRFTLRHQERGDLGTADVEAQVLEFLSSHGSDVNHTLLQLSAFVPVPGGDPNPTQVTVDIIKLSLPYSRADNWNAEPHGTRMGICCSCSPMPDCCATCCKPCCGYCFSHFPQDTTGNQFFYLEKMRHYIAEGEKYGNALRQWD